MKKLIIPVFALVMVTSCQKIKHNKIQGTWTMTEAKVSGATSWGAIGSEIEPVVISEDFISNPWNSSYVMVDKNTINVNGANLDFVVSKHNLLLTSNGDSLKLIR